MSEVTLSREQVNRFRVRRHCLTADTAAGDLHDAASRVCGAQAQVLSAAGLALAARVPGLTRAGVDAALWQQRTLAKVWAMRGTLHLLPSDELPLYTAALRPSRRRAEAAWLARIGVSQTEADAVLRAIDEALSEQPLTRLQLAEAAASRAGETARALIQRSWGGLARFACAEGFLCFGPSQGTEITFVRQDAWFRLGHEPEAEAALAEVARRYLRAYGPATARDFAAWAGLMAPEARAVWQRIAGELVTVSVGGKTASLLREDVNALADASDAGASVALLPNFDPYLLAHAEKDHLVPAHRYKHVYRIAGWVSPVILYAGQVVGTWSYTLRGGTVSFAVSLFEERATLHPQIEARAASLAAYLGGEPAITFEDA